MDTLAEINTDEIQVNTDVVAPDPRTADSRQAEAKAAEKPEGIPDSLWDAEKMDFKKDELVKAYQTEAKKALDLRAIVSKGLGKPAESIEEYQVEFDDKLKQYVSDDDQGLAAARKAAFEAGLPKETFDKFVKGYLGELAANNLLQPIAPRLTPEEQEILQKAEDDKFREEQMALLGESGQRELELIKTEIGALYKKGSLTKEDIEAFQEAAYDAKGVRFMAKLIQRYKGAQIIPTQHAVETGLMTKEEVDAMGLDKRYLDSSHPEHKAWRAKRSAAYKQLEQAGLL